MAAAGGKYSREIRAPRVDSSGRRYALGTAPHPNPSNSDDVPGRARSREYEIPIGSACPETHAAAQMWQPNTTTTTRRLTLNGGDLRGNHAVPLDPTARVRTPSSDPHHSATDDRRAGRAVPASTRRSNATSRQFVDRATGPGGRAPSPDGSHRGPAVDQHSRTMADLDRVQLPSRRR